MRQFKFLFLLITFIFFSFSFFADCSDDDSKIIVSAHGVWGDREVHIENFEIKPEEALSQLVERLSQRILEVQGVDKFTSDFSQLPKTFQDVLIGRGVKELPLVLDKYSVEYQDGTKITDTSLIKNGDVLKFSSRIDLGANLRGIGVIKGSAWWYRNFNCADLSGGSFYDADVRGAHFNGAILDGCDFRGALAQGCQFQDAKLKGSRMDYANFSGACFSNASIKGTIFKSCDLRGADFSGANWDKAHFSNCSVEGVSWFCKKKSKKSPRRQRGQNQECQIL